MPVHKAHEGLIWVDSGVCKGYGKAMGIELTPGRRQVLLYSMTHSFKGVRRLLHASMFSIELVMSRASPALPGKVLNILYPTRGPNSSEFRLTWLSRIPQT